MGAGGVVVFKVFVGQVPKTYNEARLRPYFEQFGAVTDIMVLKDRLTGLHKGTYVLSPPHPPFFALFWKVIVITDFLITSGFTFFYDFFSFFFS